MEVSVLSPEGLGDAGQSYASKLVESILEKSIHCQLSRFAGVNGETSAQSGLQLTSPTGWHGFQASEAVINFKDNDSFTDAGFCHSQRFKLLFCRLIV